jgi:hypothetical protein
MNLKLIYPHDSEGINLKKIKDIPNINNEPSGYSLIAMVASSLGVGTRSHILDRYVCFTNHQRDQVWIEKLGIIRAKRWFVFEDTRKIEDDKEWEEVFNFLKQRKILD